MTAEPNQVFCSLAVGPQVPARILVVDDEADVAELVSYHLRAKEYCVEAVTDVGSIVSHARSFDPDLVILDVMMPKMNGIQVCRMLRADLRLKRIAILFLSARSEEIDRVQGLEVGADDYLCKPFNVKELVLRVQALLRRRGMGDCEKGAGTLQVGNVALDVDRYQASVNGKPIELTATEFRLLRVLMERKGRVQARDHLLLNVWNYETEIETRTIDTHVRRLREKLGSESSLVETVRGVGYRMVDRRPAACSTSL